MQLGRRKWNGYGEGRIKDSFVTYRVLIDSDSFFKETVKMNEMRNELFIRFRTGGSIDRRWPV